MKVEIINGSNRLARATELVNNGTDCAIISVKNTNLPYCRVVVKPDFRDLIQQKTDWSLVVSVDRNYVFRTYNMRPKTVRWKLRRLELKPVQ